MATTIICGFEFKHVGEFNSVNTSGGALTISTSVFRTGAASLRFNTAGGSPNCNFAIVQSGGGVPSFAQSCRFYIRVDSNSTTTRLTTTAIGGTAGTIVELLSSGALTIADGAGGGTATSSLTMTFGDSVWHRIDVDANGTNRTLYVDGVQWAQATGRTSASAQSNFQLGSSSAITCDLYIDDLVIDNSTIGAPVSGANNKVVLLIPTAGTNAGGWTDGAGGTGDIHGSVDNLPPVGVLASTAAAKIKNATSTVTGDYVATLQTYIAAGIPAGSIINSVQAIGSHGEEVTTGNPKPGATWIASNPAQTAGTGTFDYGDNIIEGTYQQGWPTHFGTVAVAPSVTLASAPTMTVRKNLASTRVVGCCFMGVYVDYTPPPIAKNPVTVLQAVRRASFF